jgi:calcineurin-like phosphoesterase family protein
MPNIWFTANFHFGHNNIIRYCDRPFRSVEEMDQTIVERKCQSKHMIDRLNRRR